MIDHVVYAVPHLAASLGPLERRLGVRPALGGKHAGLGTHNALLSLGDGVYLEAIASDPDQPAPGRPRPFGLDTLREPRLVTWAAKAPGIEDRVERARAAGFDPGNVVELGRDRPDGPRLEWRLTLPQEQAGGGLVPFLIDWGAAPHPSQDAPQGCTLLSLQGEHPNPDTVRPLLEALEVDLAVTAAPAPALIATVQTPNGTVELR